MPGGGRVDHHRLEVVGAARRLADVPEDLPQHHRLGQRGDEAEEVAHHPVLEHRPVDPLQADLEEHVLPHRLRGAEVHQLEVGLDLGEGRPDRGMAEERGQPVTAVHLAEQRAPAAPGQLDRKGRGDGALSHPALAGHHQQTPVEQRAGHEGRSAGP